mmetsp:Transcript_257/g.1003  ORF Transcript_257/g.1003 Transcript_257/m.1003 type:complete len:209 (-) Transcript_257:1879-2505(-)
MGRRIVRPIVMIAPIAATVLTIAFANDPMIAATEPLSGPASSGTSIKTSTTVRSWKSSTEKVPRPCRVPASPRSCSTCKATAVEENARPMPTTTDCGIVSPHAIAAAAHNIVVITICAEPMPKMYLAMDWRRSRDSSSPILKRRKTTPNSARTCACATWPTRPVVYGPTAAPPRRKPSTGEPPGILETRVTARMEVNSRTRASVRPAS